MTNICQKNQSWTRNHYQIVTCSDNIDIMDSLLSLIFQLFDNENYKRDLWNKKIFLILQLHFIGGLLYACEMKKRVTH